LLEENKDKVTPEDDRAIRAALEEVRKALSSGSKESIESALKDLDAASHKLAEHLYQATGATGPGAAGSPPPGGSETGGAAPGPGGAKAPDGEVIDAAYVDVDEGKRSARAPRAAPAAT